MQSRYFEWDDRKAAVNAAKHGITFDEAKLVFLDPMAITIEDEAHSIDEDRQITIGCISFSQVLVVSHVLRGGRIRIISSRRASRAEYREYYMSQPTDRIQDRAAVASDDLLPEYDFSRGVRGKHYIPGTTLIVQLDTDVADQYETPEQVNDALRILIAEGRIPAPRRKK